MYRGMFPVLGLLAVYGCAAFGSDNDTQTGDRKVAPEDTGSFYDFTVKNIDGSDVSLSAYRDHVCLVVNVASR